MCKAHQALAGRSLVFEPEDGEEAGLHGSEVRQAQVLFQAADLRIAVTDGDRQFRLRQSRPAAQVP